MKNKIIFILYFLISVCVLFFSSKLHFILPVFIVCSLTFFWILMFTKEKENSIINENVITDETNSNQIEELNSDTFEQNNEKIESILKNVLDIPVYVESISEYVENIFKNLAKELELVQGVFFLKEPDEDVFNISGSYAFFAEKKPENFFLGEGIHGQVAKNKKPHILSDLSDRYIVSGLGKGHPVSLIILPVLSGNENILGVIELSFFKQIDILTERLLAKIISQVGIKLAKINELSGNSNNHKNEEMFAQSVMN